MKSIKDLIASLKQVAGNIGNSANNFIQQSTPFANPTSNNGNNFWGNQGGQNLANVQRAVQAVPQATKQVLSQGLNKAFNPYQAIASNPKNNMFLRGGADVVNQGLNSFVNSSTLGLVDPRLGQQQTPYGTIGKVGGFIGGLGATSGLLTKPLSVAGKVLETPARATLMRFAPQMAGSTTAKVLPMVAKAIGGSLGYAGMSTLASKAGLNEQKNQFSPGNLALNTVMQFGLEGIGNKLMSMKERMHPEDVTWLERANDVLRNKKSPPQSVQRAKDILYSLSEHYMTGPERVALADNPKLLANRLIKYSGDVTGTGKAPVLGLVGKDQSKGVGGVKTNEIKVKQPEPVQIEPLKQPNLQTDQPIVSKTTTELLGKTKTSQNPISPGSQDILPKERGLVTSVKEAQGISEPVKVNTQGTYIPKPNEQLMGEAKALLSEGATIDFKNTQGLDKKVAATIQEAINLDKSGNPEAAANLYNNLSTHATELGRGVQAFSLLDRMSPESIALSAAGKIKKYNLTATRKIPELGGDQVKMISDKVKLIDTLTGREKNIAINELSNTINDFIPSSLADKAITVWKAGLLTSLRTHERNLLGNAIHGGAEVAKDVIASPADWAMSLKTGKRTTTFTVKGLGEFGSKSTIQQVKDIVSKGYDPADAISKFDTKRINWGNNPVEQILKKYTDTVFRVLGSADKPYWNAAYARSLYDQAGAEAINVGQRGSKVFIDKLVLNPTEQMLKTAISDANVATFHNKNMASGVANALKQGLGKNELGKVVGEIAMPFTGVPSSIAGQTIAYSPVGLIKGAVDMGRVLMSDVPNLQRQAAQEIGRGVVGTGLFGLGSYLMSRGLMTGQPKDANESALWQAQGKQANSVLIGGKWRSINSIGPENIVILAGAKFKEELSKPDASLGAYAFGVGKDQLNQTFLAGVQGPLNAITDPNRYGKSYVGNQAASIIPNIVKDASKAFDPYAREYNSIPDYFKAGIPLVRNQMLPKRDNLGDIVPQEPTGVNAFFDLFNSKTPIDNATINEISRLYETGNNALPSKLSGSQTILKQKAKLTFNQLNNLEAGVGEALKPKLEYLINDPNYKKLSDEEKTKAIDNLVQDTRLIYKNVNAGQFGISPTGGYVNPSGDFKQVDTTPILKPTLTGNKTIDDKNALTYKNAVASQQTNLANSQQTGTTPDINKVYSYVDEKGVYKTVDLTPVKYPTMTGNDIVDKKLKSAYYSAINSQINDVIKLGQSGQITQDEMIKMVTALNDEYTKGKASKKLTFKKIAMPKFKISKPTALKTVKIPKLAFKMTATKGKALKTFKVAKPKTVKLASIKPLKQPKLAFKLKTPKRPAALKVAMA